MTMFGTPPEKTAGYFLRDQTATKIEGLRRALQLTDKILYGRDVTLKFVDEPQGLPAWSTKTSVHINLGCMDKDPLSPEGMAIILGVNYHEVAHMLYSPKRIDEMYVRGTLPPKKFRDAFIMLEENRVETIYCARYPRMKKWFAYPCMEYLVNDPSQWDNAFLYTHGRKYLPVDIRDKFRRVFESRYGDASEYASLIDSYRVLSVAQVASREKAAQIVYRFAELLEKDGIKSEGSLHEDSPQLGGDRGTGREQQEDASNAAVQAMQEDQDDEEAREEAKGRQKAPEKPQSPDPEESEEEEESGDEPDDTGTPPEDASGEQEDESDEESDSEDGDGEQAEPSSDDAEEDPGRGDDSEEDGDGDSSAEPGNGEVDGASDQDDVPGDEHAGSGDAEPGDGDAENPDRPGEHQESLQGGGVNSGDSPGKENPPPLTQQDRDDLTDALTNTMADVLKDEEIQREIASFENAMDDDGALSSLLERNRNNRKIPVTPEMIERGERLADIFRQLWAQLEAGWEYGTSEGSRIDMSRAALARTAEDYETLYDDWLPGLQESSGTEAVILVDESQSTWNPAAPGISTDSIVEMASKNLWELKYALQQIDAFVTVLTFNTNCYTLLDRDEQVTTSEYTSLHASGNTNPTSAIKEARRILNASEQPNKVLFVLTDGEWYLTDVVEAQESLRAMAAYATTVAILLGGLKTFQYINFFELVFRSKGDISEVMSDVVVKMLEKTPVL